MFLRNVLSQFFIVKCFSKSLLLHFNIAQFNSLNTNYKILVSAIIYWASSRFVKKRNQKFVYISFWKHVSIMSTWCDCVMWLVVLFNCLILIGWEKDAILDWLVNMVIYDFVVHQTVVILWHYLMHKWIKQQCSSSNKK